MKREKELKKYGFREMLKIGLVGCKTEYYGYMILMFFSVFFNNISTYSLKVLIDILSEEIVIDTNLSDLNILVQGFIYCFGGLEFLLNNKWFFAVIILSLAIVSSALIVIRKFMQAKFMSTMGKNFENLLFYHVENLPYNKIKSLKNGDIIQTCTTDEKTIRRFFCRDIPLVVYTSFIVLIAYTILLITSWEIGLTCMALMPFMFIYSFFLIKEVRKRYKAVDDSEGSMTAKIEENLASVRLVKAYNNEAFEITDFSRYIKDYKGKFMHYRKMSAFFFSSSDIFVFSQIGLSTIIGVILTYNHYQNPMTGITLGTLIISISFVSQIVWPLRDVATVLSNLAKASAALERINLILDEPLEDVVSGIKPPIKGDIEFKDVSFSFDDANSKGDTIKNVSFKVRSGETVAIMGKIGSGKSTLAYLLNRLYDPSKGQILLDGIDITKIQKRYLRKNISLVLQEPFLFSKTVNENLRIVDHSINENEIKEATKIAQVDKTIMSFEKGYDTAVGEKGTTLSGGQKQRVAIARTILTKAPVVVFDDSLSAVDTETDFNIRKALKERTTKVTSLIITHRIATAKDADLIIVLDNGKISEIGKHDDLIKRDGLYKRIYQIQTKMV